MDQGDSGGAHLDPVSNPVTEPVTDSLTGLGTNPAIDSAAIR
jgi:hypothetical protein